MGIVLQFYETKCGTWASESKQVQGEVEHVAVRFASPRGAIDPALNDFRYPFTVDVQQRVQRSKLNTDPKKNKKK